MHLVYCTPDNTAIKVMLAEDETWRGYSGPTLVFVPVNDDNPEYAALAEQELEIAPYDGPPPLPASV
jgi:hypothetical protein